MANPYIPKLGPSAATALPGLPRRKSTAAASISGAFNWQLPVVYSGKSFLVSAQETTPSRVRFSGDGLNMYVFGTANRTVYQYSLALPWDVSTAAYASKSFLLTAQEPSARAIAFSVDGSKLYTTGTNTDAAYQYTLSTAWDVSTASYSGKSKSVAAEDLNPISLDFSGDGLSMYMLGISNNSVFQYDLSVAWDLSTASYSGNSKSVAIVISQSDLALSADGDKLYIIGQGDSEVYQFTLSTPWDISTAGDYDVQVSVVGQESSGAGVSFRTDGSIMYAIGQGADTVFQYTVGDYT